MLGYVLMGAGIGAVAGYLIPPGVLFWFTMGAVGGYVTCKHINYRKY